MLHTYINSSFELNRQCHIPLPFVAANERVYSTDFSLSKKIEDGDIGEMKYTLIETKCKWEEIECCKTSVREQRKTLSKAAV